MIKMKGVSVLVFIALFLGVSSLSCCKFSNRINSLPENKFYDSVAVLQSLPGDKGYRGGTATGFAIDRKHLLTAGHFCHSIDNFNKEGLAGDKISIVRSDKRGMPRIPILGTVVAYDKGRDICILRSPGHSMRVIELAKSASSVLTEDAITVIGAPSGFFPVRREGTVISVSGYRFQKYSDMLFIAVNIEAGNSGSPVIWKDKVIGMIVLQPLTVHETALAVPIDEIREFIKKTIAK
jgi:V8-like Glu-specific endopeptidase